MIMKLRINMTIKKRIYVGIHSFDSNLVSKSECHDSIYKSEKLFMHNQITYFGNRNLMYGSMQLLSGIKLHVYCLIN